MTSSGPGAVSFSVYPRFGCSLPSSEPSWYHSHSTPYYSPSHCSFRHAVREWVEREIMPFTTEWEEEKAIPVSARKAAARAGFLLCVVGAPLVLRLPPSLSSLPLPGGVKRKEFDVFHELIVTDELARVGSAGVMMALMEGSAVGLPPIIEFGSAEQREKCVGPVLSGEKAICLCITEPGAGSDIANISTSATLSPSGDEWIIKGEKKFITNGVFADFFVVACRTGGKGVGGISLLLAEKGMKGLGTRPMKCQGSWASGTTLVTFDDVRVPRSNLIGQEGAGFKYMMNNTNHERWIVCGQAVRFARICYEDAFTYALKRETFGKKLIEHAVIRLKLAHMARQIDATWAQLESITQQIKAMPAEEAYRCLAAPLALLKVQSTQTLSYCVAEAAQIFGGLAYTRGGPGERVERIMRDALAMKIGGGSEEILCDFAIRDAVKKHQQKRAKL